MSLTQYRTQLFLDESRYQWLVVKARQEEKSLAAVIRQMIDQERDDHKGPTVENKLPYNRLKTIIGIVKKGKGDISKRHDYYLAETILQK